MKHASFESMAARDWSDLSAVKKYADELALHGSGQTVILRPRMSTFNIIPTSREKDLLRDATVVYRTKTS